MFFIFSLQKDKASSTLYIFAIINKKNDEDVLYFRGCLDFLNLNFVAASISCQLIVYIM